MKSQFQIGDLAVEVVHKNIKNVHLSVHPPVGRVTIAAPIAMKMDTLRVYTIAKLGWIRAQQKKMLLQDREPPREFLNRESHYLWGQRYLMQVCEADAPPSIAISHNHLVMKVRQNVGVEKKQELLDGWYRDQLKVAIPALLAHWEPQIGVKTNRFFVQRMKTQWGSCNPSAKNIRINTELAKKPRECLEYIVVHELMHLLEPSHNERFIKLMDKHMPKWHTHRQLLNSLPLRYEQWSY
jgi:predicted metal-dependent hydrolase